MAKIGIDFHGVIDKDPIFFRDLTNRLRGIVEIHIISGGTKSDLIPKLDKLGIHYDKIYSISNHMECSKEPSLTYNSKGEVLVDTLVWNKAKGNYCRSYGINIMIDDSIEYKEHMPSSTHFHLYT